MKLKDFLDEAKKKTTLDNSVGECEECGKKGKVYVWNDEHTLPTFLCRKCTLEREKEYE